MICHNINDFLWQKFIFVNNRRSSTHHNWWQRWEDKRLARNAQEEQKFFEFAKVCQEAQRFQDMAQAMKKVVKLRVSQQKDLSEEQRDLLLLAYKHLIDSHISSWRTLNAAEKDLMVTKEEHHLEKREIVKERKKVEHEIQECEQIIRLINNFLIPIAAKETVEFYRKVKLEYYGYLFETGVTAEIEAKLEPEICVQRMENLDCPGSEDELNCYQYQQDKIEKTHFEKAFEKAIKSATREKKKLLRGIVRNMNPDQLNALAKSINEYVKSIVYY
uniref:14-3-3 domain-containing protein n=1 Tax=Ditylenchus dipsaci TaxID=166011 RepID=A0A915CVQ7_9BILA